MMIKTINVMVSALVAFSIWCAAVLFTILVLHVVAIGGLTAFHLMHS